MNRRLRGLQRQAWLLRPLRAARNLTRFKIPLHLERRFRHLAPSATEELKTRLLEFRQAPSDRPQEDEDLHNHLFRRLAENRRQIVPWLDAAKPLEGTTILEIGCGTGSATVALAEQGARLTAIDVDPRSIAVAEERCRLHGVQATFLVANAARLDEVLSAERFDFIIFFASLEHMTHAERLAAMSHTWKMLPSGGLWCVVETPNRLWYYDHHTAHLDFFMWLSDELAADYIRFSPREDVRDQIERADDRQHALCRAGRGVSFHEFDLTLGKASELQIVSSMPLFYRRRDPALRLLWRLSDDYRFERFLARRCPQIHAAFLQPSLDIIVRKP
ncbi:MAG TPA: methyltransferase domain-containing protein [Pirellulales bacterium]|nr:methyltransferase domain-containing protein [Pirellulales bacterium]